MSRRTLGLVAIRFKPDKKSKLSAVTDVDGADMLHLFHGLVTNLDADKLVHHAKGRYTKIESIVASGRSVLVKTESGPFGEVGQTIDVNTHQVSHVRGDNESATTMTRTFFMVPPGSEVALFVVERQGSATGGTQLIDLFKGAMLSTYPDHFFPDETVVESDAWSAAAGLKSVTAVRYTLPLNIADGTTAIPIKAGVVRQTLEPGPGFSFLPRALWDGIRNLRIKSSEFLAFDGQDADETIVELVNGDQTKTYVLGKERQPSIRVVVTDEGEPSLTDIDLARRAADEAKTYFNRMGFTWSDQWLTGQWSPTALLVRLEPR
ncbi:hypothetical protein [Cryobacterium luteum]|uniref:Uncharacterized protein n=1 Tax=Cryobacterium luteum TaxID=1424661 RepID=A0A1H8EEW8_9MICO|nr:hypothetical protein [Cryobacterium luteum]TFB89902.1 hypothetical protein E3O10_09020 [Cryobacterium luteum]SEN18055.1 hypothetical protein SAMN05216281_104249 [Cryobacterium luteum]